MKKSLFLLIFFAASLFAVVAFRNTDDGFPNQSNLLDWTQIDPKWKYLCVTSYNSGDPYFSLYEPSNLSEAGGKIGRQLNSLTPKDWDEDNVYVFVYDRNNDFEKKKISLKRIPQYDIYPFYDFLSHPDGYGQCALRSDAILRCVNVNRSGQSKCLLLFELRKP